MAASGLICPKYLRVRDVKQFFNISESLVRKWVLHRELPYTKAGATILIATADIEEKLAARRVPARRPQ